MPQKNNKIYCINHPNDEMEPFKGFNALTKLVKTGEKFSFHPSSGVPIKGYFCRKCGYIETYVAIVTDEWKNE